MDGAARKREIIIASWQEEQESKGHRVTGSQSHRVTEYKDRRQK